ncbi:hypothetical protein VKT23_014018 [Stygiomarasmius scandens]|uniref:Uncharacterized protein n=1 Tax=Marasmiellus scandens TaxID=2682957 RepID=A0ABR1J545_9AGAR
MAFSEDGCFLAVAPGQGVQVWDIRMPEPHLLGTYLETFGETSAVIRYKNNSFITGHSCGTIQVVTVERSVPRITTHILTGHCPEGVLSLAIKGDHWLAVRTTSQIRLYEVSLGTASFMGTIPPPSITQIIPKAAYWIENDFGAVHLVVCYAGNIVVQVYERYCFSNY